MYAYVGTRTTKERNARGLGISVFSFNESIGNLALIQVVGDLVNPSFLAINRTNTRLYAVHGDSDYVSAFSIAHDGQLRYLNSQSTHGKNPVHLALDESERFLVVSNHSSSSLAVLPIDEDGAIQALSQLVPLDGTPGPHRIEQAHAKPHFNPFNASGTHVLVPDKGLDKTFVFRFEQGKLQSEAVFETIAREGAGPRHLAFHPSGQLAYVINELDSTVSACRYEPGTGRLTPFQVVSSLADTFTANSRASEIECSKDGRFVYASNRGEDSIAVFSIDHTSGRLARIQTQASLGKTPRFFALSPENQWLFALNEDSDSIVTFAIDASTGKLSPAGAMTNCASPVCMVFTSRR